MDNSSNYPFLKKISKPIEIEEKPIYKNDELLIWKSTEEYKLKKQQEIEDWQKEQKTQFEKNLKNYLKEEEAIFTQKTLNMIDKINKNQQEYQNFVIEHCYSILKEAWHKLTGELSAENQIKSILHQLTPKILSDMYCELQCHCDAVPLVETFLYELGNTSPQANNIKIVEDTKISPNRIQLQAKRGGTVVIDYTLSLDVLRQAFMLSYEKGN